MKIFKNGILLFEDKKAIDYWINDFGKLTLVIKGLFENFNIDSVTELKNSRLKIFYLQNSGEIDVYLNCINYFNDDYVLYFSVFPTFNWKKEGF